MPFQHLILPDSFLDKNLTDLRIFIDSFLDKNLAAILINRNFHSMTIISCRIGGSYVNCVIVLFIDTKAYEITSYEKAAAP